MADLNANHDTQIIVVSAVFGSLMVLSFAARIASKRIRRTTFGLDDILLGIALVAALIENIWYGIATHAYGIGHHLKSLRKDQISGFQKMFYASEFTQTTGLAFAKLSLILLLYQIFVVRAFRITCWVLAAIVIAWYMTGILAGALMCLPVESLWNNTIPGHCGNQRLLEVSEPIPWILTDFAVLIAPLPMIRKLHLPRGQRFGLAGLFLLGSVTCITSCIRYSTVWYTIDDVTWDIAAATYWNLIEVDLGVIVVSLIVSRPVLARAVPDQLLRKIGTSWAKYMSRKGRLFSTESIFRSFRRAPDDPPVLPSFTDSQIQLADKKKVVEDSAVEDMDGIRLSNHSGEVV